MWPTAGSLAAADQVTYGAFLRRLWVAYDPAVLHDTASQGTPTRQAPAASPAASPAGGRRLLGRSAPSWRPLLHCGCEAYVYNWRDDCDGTRLPTPPLSLLDVARRPADMSMEALAAHAARYAAAPPQAASASSATGVAADYFAHLTERDVHAGVCTPETFVDQGDGRSDRASASCPAPGAALTGGGAGRPGACVLLTQRQPRTG